MIQSTTSSDLQAIGAAAAGQAYDLAYLCAQVKDNSEILALTGVYIAGVANAQLGAEGQMVEATAQADLAAAQAAVSATGGMCP